MQQNGTGETSNGEQPALSFRTPSPLPMATSRARRFAQEGRAVPQPRVMVVFSAASETDKQGDAMSSSECADDEYRKPPMPAPSLNLGKSLRTFSPAQEVRNGLELLLARLNLKWGQATEHVVMSRCCGLFRTTEKLACFHSVINFRTVTFRFP